MFRYHYAGINDSREIRETSLKCHPKSDFLHSERVIDAEIFLNLKSQIFTINTDIIIVNINIIGFIFVFLGTRIANPIP